MEFSHVSVLLKETVDGAFTDPKGVYADLTTGGLQSGWTAAA